jgi:hypothetical protein
VQRLAGLSCASCVFPFRSSKGSTVSESRAGPTSLGAQVLRIFMLAVWGSFNALLDPESFLALPLLCEP